MTRLGVLAFGDSITNGGGELQWGVALQSWALWVARGLGLPFTGKSLTHNYVLGDLHVAGDVPEDQLSIFLGRNGFLAVFPMGDGRFRFMATDPDVMARSGRCFAVSTLARQYGFTDLDGHTPPEVRNLASYLGEENVPSFWKIVDPFPNLGASA